jgi:DNA primase
MAALDVSAPVSSTRTLRYPQHVIQEVRARTNLVALISRDVALKPAGRSHKGLCPFHEEKSPSFIVTGQRWECFGCKRKGDAIEYLVAKRGLTFLDALRALARDASVELPSLARPAPVLDLHAKALTFAAGYFAQQLEGPGGAPAREYLLRQRGVTAETAARYGVGYAPADWAGLTRGLSAARLAYEAGDLGLLSKRKSQGHYDFFRDRVTFQLRSETGQLVGFGGRYLGTEPETPKYLNTPESARFKKREHLFGLDVALPEIRRTGRVVLVEGYFDVLGLHQAGVREVVGLSSTAFTPAHVQKLRAAGAKEATLLFDGDKAGAAAIEPAAQLLLPSSLAARVAHLPVGYDPDTYALEHGEAGLRSLLSSSTPLSVALLTRLLPEGTAATFEEKLTARSRLLELFAALPPGFARTAIIAAAAAHFGVTAADFEGPTS